MNFFKRKNAYSKKPIMVQCPNIGDLKFEAVSKEPSEKLFICRDNQAVMTKYKPTLRLTGLSENNVTIYEEALEYIDSIQDNLEKNLKALYLDAYEPESIEESFRITDIGSPLYETLLTTIAEAQEDDEKFHFDFDGLPELKAFTESSKEDHVFFEIISTFVSGRHHISIEEYALAYINYRTKEICYCYQAF